MKRYELFIDGVHTGAASRQTVESTDPATGTVVARVARAMPTDARRAIAAARAAFDDGRWSTRPPEWRTEVLLSAVELLWSRRAQLSRLETLDTGIPIRTTTTMIASALHQVRDLVNLAAGIPGVESLPHNDFPSPSQNLLMRDPYGVCAAIVPFAAPFAIAAWKVFAALAMGNTVVLKPSPSTPCTAMELAAALDESGLPAGCLNVLCGADARVGEELVGNTLVDRVTFTGSTETGRTITRIAAQTVKRVTLGLGGKSANIMLDDADLDVAVPGALWAVYLAAGQTCTAGSRLLVPLRIADEVTDRIVSAATQLRAGPTLEWETDLGPLASPALLAALEQYVGVGRSEGAALACGGHRLTEDAFAGGCYYAPTVLTGVRGDMRVAQEEVLGPVLSIIPYADTEEAVAIANSTIYGLAAAVWSRDVPRAISVAQRLRAGTVWINDYHMLTAAAPFGGYAQSGIGRELGIAGLLEYAQSKHVWVGERQGLDAYPWTPVIGLDRIFGASPGISGSGT